MCPAFCLLAVLFPALHSDGLWDVLSDSDAIVCANRVLNVSQTCHTLSTLRRLLTVRVHYQGQLFSNQDFLATLLVKASLAHDMQPQRSLSLVRGARHALHLRPSLPVLWEALTGYGP